MADHGTFQQTRDEANERSAPTVAVFANGDPPPARARDEIGAAAAVVAADGGALHALPWDWPVDHLVGDLDSLSPSQVDEFERRGARVERHPSDKDETDLELALATACDIALPIGAQVVVLGAHGGRVDHELANVALLGSPRWRACRVAAWLGTTRCDVVWPERPLSFAGDPGSIVSLLPLGGPCDGVRTSGLAYALLGEPLQPFSSRGVSNQMSASQAIVSVTAGALLVARPSPAGGAQQGDRRRENERDTEPDLPGPPPQTAGPTPTQQPTTTKEPFA